MTTYTGIWDVREAVQKGVPGADRIEARSTPFNNGFGTHLPLLASVVAVAGPGPVLECGSGHFSTPVLKQMCDAMGREFVVLDYDAEWLKVHEGLGVDARHVTDWKKWPVEEDRKWAVIFVDNEPSQDRLTNIYHAANIAEFVVVHDTLNGWFKGMDSMLDLTFKYRYDYTHMAPCTTVVSNVRAFPGGTYV